MTRHSQTIAEAIEAVAAKRFGSACVLVTPYVVSEHAAMHGDAGRWFILSVDGEVLGRRRTKLELLKLIQGKAPAAI